MDSNPRQKVEPRFDPDQLRKESRGNALHPQLRVETLLMLPMRGLRGLFQRDDGKPIRPVEAKQRLFRLKAKGAVWVAVGEKCEGWNEMTGCPHAASEAQP